MLLQITHCIFHCPPSTLLSVVSAIFCLGWQLQQPTAVTFIHSACCLGCKHGQLACFAWASLSSCCCCMPPRRQCRHAARAIVVAAVVIIIGTLSFGERRCNIFNKVFTKGQGMIYENEWENYFIDHRLTIQTVYCKLILPSQTGTDNIIPATIVKVCINCTVTLMCIE